jgi:putative colanic acid biosysnthesis UDP-glucose lipid carrier transferase
MPARYSRYLKTIYLLGDVLLLNAVFCVVSFYFKWPRLNADPNFLAQFLYINPLWIICTFITNIHQIDRGLRVEQIVRQLIRHYLLFAISIIVFLYFLDYYFIPVFHLELKLFYSGIVFLFWRLFMSWLINFMRRRGLNYRNVIIVGNGQPAMDMQRYFVNHPEVGYRLMGIFCDQTLTLKKVDISGGVKDAIPFAIDKRIDEIYCSLSGLENQQVKDLMEFADRSLIRFKVIPDFRGLIHRKVEIDFYEMVPVLSMRNEPLQNVGNQIVKRAFDFTFSLLFLITLYPLFYIIIAPIIKLTSKGPVFFKQLRSGLNNETFVCWKFRTMQVNTDADTLQAVKGDARITAIGKFLRKTSLDELPQFYNVLLGHMSVVGPRPHMLKHTEEYSKVINKFMVRHLVKPGVTGWAQVNGLRGETQDPLLMEKRVESDVWYLENWSLLLDIKIILLTIWQIISGELKGG